jgi:phosphoribosylanthranilate isomerase
VGTFVKICGIASRDDAEAVADLKPDAMGFLLWTGSKRYAKPEDVYEWTRDFPASLLKVGVFVDASPEDVRRAVETAHLDVAQLHGVEHPEAYAHLDVRLWKVVRVEKSAALSAPDVSRVDAYLVDTYSSESPGGTGGVGDWRAAREFVKASDTRVLLAGGLNPDNVQQAIREVEPWGVDVSSGVEERPGKKDIRRVRAFIEKCREV